MAPEENAPTHPPRAKQPKPAVDPDRLAREAAALRANLAKRKEQARQRAVANPEPPAEE